MVGGDSAILPKPIDCGFLDGDVRRAEDPVDPLSVVFLLEPCERPLLCRDYLGVDLTVGIDEGSLPLQQGLLRWTPIHAIEVPCENEWSGSGEFRDLLSDQAGGVLTGDRSPVIKMRVGKNEGLFASFLSQSDPTDNSRQAGIPALGGGYLWCLAQPECSLGKLLEPRFLKENGAGLSSPWGARNGINLEHREFLREEVDLKLVRFLEPEEIGARAGNRFSHEILPMRPGVLPIFRESIPDIEGHYGKVFSWSDEELKKDEREE